MEKWFIKNKNADFEKIIEECQVGEVLARCLVNKDLKEVHEINKFLNPRLEDQHDPFLMKDMDKAINILVDKIKQGKSIRIIGDYDVDGIMSTYILYKTFSQLGAKVDYILPDRIEDGFGLNKNMVNQAHSQGIDTIITCDNGIAAIEEVDLAKARGMTVIISDHHDLPQTNGESRVPRADAVVNPHQEDCKYPFKNICGGVIAYKIALALIKSFDGEKHLPDIESFKKEILGFNAFATVCDVMDLVEENRVFVKFGLEALRESKNYGLNALIEATEIPKESLSVYHLGFVLGPCFNSSGRLDFATRGVDLLLAKSQEEAMVIAKELKELNEKRKTMTQEALEQALQLIENTDLKKDKVLVIYVENCHESLAGIIAGRIKEAYHKPTIVLTKAKVGVKGSARSIENYDIYKELNKVSQYMSRFGGHPMAAGMSMEEKNIEAFRLALNNNDGLTKDMLMRKISIDGELPMTYISEELMEELQRLEPFGKGNSKPLFAKRDLSIMSFRVLGKNQNVLKFMLKNKQGQVMEAMYFGNVQKFFEYMTDKYGLEEVERLKSGGNINMKLTITYQPSVNEFNKRRTLQMIIQNFR